jgi:hypothetical protein
MRRARGQARPEVGAALPLLNDEVSMRPFDRYSIVFVTCIAALVVAMGMHAWVGDGRASLGLFTGGPWVPWQMQVARYLATIGVAIAIATVAVATLVGTVRMRAAILGVLGVAFAALIGFAVLVDIQLATLPRPAFWVSVTALAVAMVTARFGLRARTAKTMAPLAMVWCADCGGAAQWIPSHNRVWCQHCALTRNRHLWQGAPPQSTAR